jgi:hypothetical protein
LISISSASEQKKKTIAQWNLVIEKVKWCAHLQIAITPKCHVPSNLVVAVLSDILAQSSCLFEECEKFSFH